MQYLALKTVSIWPMALLCYNKVNNSDKVNLIFKKRAHVYEHSLGEWSGILSQQSQKVSKFTVMR